MGNLLKAAVAAATVPLAATKDVATAVLEPESNEPSETGKMVDRVFENLDEATKPTED